MFRSRTPFAAFARSSIHLSRDAVVATSSAFPIPLPCIGVFGRMPSGLSSSQRAKLHFRRALCLVVLALNFRWSGGVFVEEKLLKRTPSSEQNLIIRRIVSFMQTDGPRVPFAIATVGRRIPKLVARISELSDLLTSVGSGSSPYDKMFPGFDDAVPIDNSVAEELEPYRSLDSKRLKIVGTGHWDPTDLMSDELVMAFRNPDSLLFDRPPGAEIPKITDPMPEVLALARLWDRFSLLVLHEFDVPQHYPEEQVKIFNAYKDHGSDRQIGDRRGRNSWEMRVAGPSKVLPTGVDLVEFDFNCKTHRLAISITDRKDFYHQFRVPFVRSLSNTLGPGLAREELVNTSAYKTWLARRSVKADRLQVGDGLEAFGRFPKPSKAMPDTLFCSFGSVLQGDHGGVEYACDAHQGLLQGVGLLSPPTRLAANRPFQGLDFLDGLVIDDYFSLSAHPLHQEGPSKSAQAFDDAQRAYKAAALLGSPAKDLRDVDSGKVIGASVNASSRARSYGICPVGAPGQKRFALSWISMQLSTMSHTSDVLHLCLIGGWVACLGFRRPMMSLLNHSFRLVDASRVDPLHPRVIPLPRSVATELLLVALLCPLAVSDLCVPYQSEVFSTDASNEKGAICSAPISVDFARVLWRCSRSKGAYHRLLTPMESLSRNLGILEETPQHLPLQPERPLAFHYDFIEIFAGASTVTAAVSALGFTVGPPIDLSISPEYDVSFPHVMRWLSYMLASGSLLSFITEPPCTTFSIMRRPALRSRLCPYGFDVKNRQTSNGNLLSCRALQAMHVGYINGIPGLLERPFSSLLKHLPPYRSFVGKPGVSQCRTDSCMLGSIHLKSFSFLGVHMDLSGLAVRCDGSHEHVQIQGAYTKKSATYTPALAQLLAKVFAKAITGKKDELRLLDSIPCKGLESQLVNSVALSADWKVDAVWSFKKKSHINILEFSVLERLAKRLANKGGSVRASCLVDSHVVSAASAKGRTSSFGLAPVLRRFCALSVACALYFSTPYVPTRLNVSDDPTRSVALRSASGSFDVSDWSDSDLYRLASLPKLRRWASNWLRLLLSLSGPSLLWISDRSTFRRAFPACGCVVPLPPSGSMDFDATLGFPGEGPLVRGLALFLRVLQLLTCCTKVEALGFSPWFMLVLLPSVEAMHPRNTADLGRSARRSTMPLAIGRPVLPTTSLNREILVDVFLKWCENQGVDFDVLLQNSLFNVEEINSLLAAFGRQLYGAGRPYGHFSETINGVVGRSAILRRHLQPAWDVAYAWMRNEPPLHRTACPWQVCLALISVSLLWGWTKEAGIIALCFGGILRAGEALKSFRRDLLLPDDAFCSNSFCLLAIDEAKTRFSAARHQCAKIDAPDLMVVISLAFKKLLPNEHLWPWSSQTFRNRFKTLLTSLDIPTTVVNGCRPLDPGSLRPGGATWLLQATENSEMVRRRGRWTSTKVLEIYLQETACVRFLSGLSPSQRLKIQTMAECFPGIVSKANLMAASDIPTHTWFKVFSWT